MSAFMKLVSAFSEATDDKKGLVPTVVMVRPNGRGAKQEVISWGPPGAPCVAVIGPPAAKPLKL
jgi:hypothetical protein